MPTKKTAKQPTSQQKLVINTIEIKTLNRQSQDIESWRSALKSADNNRRSRLYKLYEDILLDNVLSDAIDKRIRAITNAQLTFTVNNNEVDDITELMDRVEFENMLREILLARMWGVTVLEFDYSKLFKAHSIPRTHIRPDKGVITISENDETGVNYRGDDFFLEIEGTEKFGLILKACPYVIYKRGNFGDWAQFAELFGMPFRIGKYNSYDEATRIQLQEALKDAGSAAYAVIPKEGDIEYRDNNSKGDGKLYDTLRKACNEEILYGILGQSMTTVQGDKGARSLGEVHLQVEEGIHADDRRFITRILNAEILPRLEARGFPVKGGRFGFPEVGETLGLQDKIGIDKQLDEIIEIEADYFYETYGIPRPKNGGGKKAKKSETENGKANEEEKGKEQKKRVKLSASDKNWFQRLLGFSDKPRGRRGTDDELDRLYNS